MDILHVPISLLDSLPWGGDTSLAFSSLLALDGWHGWLDGLTQLGSDWHAQGGALLAQAGKPQQFDQNILADLSRAWNNFIRSGQAAALGIGLFVGYMFRVFTSSG